MEEKGLTKTWRNTDLTISNLEILLKEQNVSQLYIFPLPSPHQT